jgi:hypothetical protein
MTANEQKVLDHSRTQIEKVMLQLPSDTPESHSAYLAGYIDALSEMGILSENNREILYSEYAS